MSGIAGFSEYAGYGRVREYVFQGKLRPTAAIEVCGPLGHGFLPEFLEIRTVHERAIDNHGHAEILQRVRDIEQA